MIPTPTGLIFILIGCWLWFKPPIQMFVFACVCTLFPAAAAVDLPALGGSSIPPAMLALGFLGLRLLRGDVMRSPGPTLGLSKNAWMLTFSLYAAVTALVLPRLFAGRISVVPMGRAGLGLLPLQVTAQNTTQAVYLVGTGFAAMAATVYSTRVNSARVVVKTFIVLTWIHALTGLADAVLSAAHIQGVFDFARTGSYAQLDQNVGSFHRISALCPEPSVYAALGGVYFVFMCELWLRAVSPKTTGPAALLMALVLGLSTSSTAYIVLGSYAVLLTARAILIPGSMTVTRAVILTGVGMLGVALGLTAMLLRPGLAAEFGDTLLSMTVNKSQSASAFERSLWAKQGWDAMVVSHGLGIGVGSFRSSSMITAMLGSVGPAGALVFLVYVLQVAKLGRLQTYQAKVDERTAAGAAAGWTALMVLPPAATTFASADPGLLFAVMAGLSLGWRSHVLAPPARREVRAPSIPVADATVAL